MRTPAPSVAFDIGGTFTDIVMFRPGGEVMTDKVLSGPDLIPNVRRMADEALRRSGHRALASLLHATTLASNALLQGTGPVLGLLTTKGFRDELEIRRDQRPSVYDFSWQRIPPLIPRRRRMEVTERIDARGQVTTALDLDETETALLALKRQGIEALAICFVNSYANPVHERAAADLARRLLPDVIVCTSHEVLPQIREYERTSTTSLNAYLIPVVRDYLGDVERHLAGYSPVLRIMQSNGGMMTPARARRTPIHMVESGPAGGVLAAAALTRAVGIDEAVSFDMGGTTAKACLIEGKTPLERIDWEVGGDALSSASFNRGVGYALSASSLDIVEVGAGGGSIARIEDGILRVGPVSAGAAPGPAAYSRGGTQPTVTDANIVLGFINPNAIAGGAVPIDRQAAARAIDEALGVKMKGKTVELAYGIFEVVNAAMMRSLQAVTTERGRDPRAHTLIAFGGSGPVHAVALADMLGMKKVCVPLYPGLFSAIGLLLADLRYDQAESCPALIDDQDLAERVNSGYEALTRQVRDQAASEGVDSSLLAVEALMDLRYAAQSSEITIRMPSQIDARSLGAVLGETFNVEHERLYGYRRDAESIKLVNLRLRAWIPAKAASIEEIGRSFHLAAQSAEALESARLVYFGPELGELQTKIVDRYALLHRECRGPAIIEEFSTTIVVPPGWQATLDDLGDVIIERL